MWIVLVLALLGGCKQVFDLEGYVPDERPHEEPFAESVIGTTRAGTIVAATRDAFGFPDAALEYRLYLRGERFAHGILETSDWNRAVSYDASTSTYRFDLVTERCVVDDAGVGCDRVER
jgi:hypothetical protein